MINKLKEKLASAFLATFETAAVSTSSYACFWVLHQPEEPACLREKDM